MVEIFENIRKIYEFRAPCSVLTDHIEFFSESSAIATRQFIKNQHFTVKMFPSWTPTMYVNLGEPYHISVGKQCSFIPHDRDILILRDTIVERHNSPSDHIFTVKFLPGSLEYLLDIPPIALISRVTDLRNVLPQQLLDQIRQAVDFKERVWLAENFLLMKIRKKEDHRFNFVREAISAYSNADAQPSLNDLSRQFFMSSKTLNRNFHRVIGSSPKQYFSTLRARTALMAYVGQKRFVPAAHGYFDMSHFYKEVTHFTGQKLTTYSRNK
jgi:AraC-like DNA-binding protein